MLVKTTAGPILTSLDGQLHNGTDTRRTDKISMGCFSSGRRKVHFYKPLSTPDDVIPTKPRRIPSKMDVFKWLNSFIGSLAFLQL